MTEQEASNIAERKARDLNLPWSREGTIAKKQGIWPFAGGYLVTSRVKSDGAIVTITVSARSAIAKPKRVEYPAGGIVAVLFLLVVSGLCGCSKSVPLPKELAQQIAAADRVILTNSFSSLTFSSAEAQNLVQAVSNSKRERIEKGTTTSCPSGSYLRFYRGTNLLVQVFGHDTTFKSPMVTSIAMPAEFWKAAWTDLYQSARR